MKTAALIRTHKYGLEEVALKSTLSSYFGRNVFFIFENFQDLGGRNPPSDAGPSFVMTSSFLAEKGLARFRKAGWQCGDYSYYAGATQFPGFDFYWLVEPDVHFTFDDIGDFFSGFSKDETQFRGFKFGERSKAWGWYESMSRTVDGKVYGVQFPLTRMAGPAALHLLPQRAGYCRSAAVKDVLTDGDPGKLFANDEAFVASILQRDGFSCGSLEQLAGNQAISEETFSTQIPIMPQQLDQAENRNRVIHPVRQPGGARRQLVRLMKRDAPLFRERMAPLIERYGAHAWETWSGISVSEARLALSL